MSARDRVLVRAFTTVTSIVALAMLGDAGKKWWI